MAGTTGWKRFLQSALLVAPFTAFSHIPINASAAASGDSAVVSCPSVPWSGASVVQAGHPYISVAFEALARDRQRYAGLGALHRSLTLSAVAEAHSAYMASISSWSDGDPSGTVLARVRAAGVDASYAGQNVVTANGDTVQHAVQNGEAFFAREAGTGGPHWDNITNPDHHYVGMGIALLGTAGDYTIYLTQVFADAGGCEADTQSNTASTSAAAYGGTPRVGSVVVVGTDYLSLRTEPAGTLIETLRATQSVKVVSIQGDWVQVEVLDDQMYGWVYAPLLGQTT